MVRVDNQHQFIIEHRAEQQIRQLNRIRRHQHINLARLQGRHPVKTERCPHLKINIRPFSQKLTRHPHQPLFARVTLHADPQNAPAAARHVRQDPLGMFESRQYPLGQREKILARRRQLQRAPLLAPKRDLKAVLQLGDGVAHGGLADVQPVRRGRDAAGAADFANDGQMLTLNDYELHSCSNEKMPFLLINWSFIQCPCGRQCVAPERLAGCPRAVCTSGLSSCALRVGRLNHKER